MNMSDIGLSEGKSSVIQACRACLDTKSKNYVPFDSEGGVSTELYKFCVGLPVTPYAGSQFLCCKCSELIKQYVEFKKQCEKSEEFWLSLLPGEVKCNTIKVENYEHHIVKINGLEDSIIENDKQYEDTDLLKEENSFSDRDVDALEENIFNETHSEIKLNVKRKGKVDNDMKKWKCDKCQKSYKNKKWLGIHLKKCQEEIKRDQSKTRELYCGLCDFTSDQELMKQHLDIHALTNDLNCGSCDFTGKDFASMLSHRYSHQPKDLKPKLFCHLCNNKIRSCSYLQFHYRTVHLNKHGLDCTMCNKSFKTYKCWRNHDRWHRVDKYICDVCGKKFLFRHAIETHMIDHADFSKYICETCGRGFKRLFNLKCHVSNRHVTHAPVKCSHCNKTFKSDFNLQNHLRLVTKEKTFSCPVCPKKFPSEITMKNHLFWHGDERPFSCEVCGGTYKAKGQLKIHMRQHTGIMPFKCQHCDRSFASSNQLRVHTSVHTGVRRYKCNYCQRTFHSKKLVESHCAAQHKDREIQLNMN